MKGLSLDILTVMGMEPLSYISLASALGCDYIGMQVTPVTTLPELYASWTLRDNSRLMRDIRSALADHGLSIHLGEGFILLPGMDVRNFAADIDVLAEVGARAVNMCCADNDHARAFDALASFAEMALQAGMSSNVEFVPTLGIADLPTAAEAVRHVASPDFGIVIDAMHFFRSGSVVEDITHLDPAMIGYVQICDLPTKSAMDYATEACFERRCPGEGDLPLGELIAMLPSDAIIGLETPMRSRILGGGDPAAVFGPCVAAVRSLFG